MFFVSFFVAVCYKADGYDPRKSKVSDNTMDAWKSSGISGVLTDVPGIGPGTADKLTNDNVSNTYQLVGKYLTLKGPGEVSVHELNQRFWFYLKSIGVTAHRSSIVQAVYEKCSTWFPAFYDATVNDEEEDDDDE